MPSYVNDPIEQIKRQMAGENPDNLTRYGTGGPDLSAPVGGGGSSYIDQLLRQIQGQPGAPIQGVPDFNDPESWPAWLVNAMNQANRASKQQLNNVLGLLMGGGQAAKEDSRQAFNQQIGGINQSATDRGLYNSTVPLTMAQGATREYARQNQRIDESTADRSAGVLERANYNSPDLQMFSSLFQGAGRALGGRMGNSIGGGSYGSGNWMLGPQNGGGGGSNWGPGGIPVGNVGQQRFRLNGRGPLLVNGKPFMAGVI